MYGCRIRCTRTENPPAYIGRLSACLLIANTDYNNTMHVYSVTVMTHVIALEAGQSSKGVLELFKPVTSALGLVWFLDDRNMETVCNMDILGVTLIQL